MKGVDKSSAKGKSKYHKRDIKMKKAKTGGVESKVW